jgi:uncharacterized protein with HEPN domain
MSSREVTLYLEDMITGCADILEFTHGISSANELTTDRRTFLAVVRCLEIIGEASRQVPQEFKDNHGEIPWREISSLRNIIAHEYFGLDQEILWDVVQTQIPDLHSKLKKIHNEKN